MDSVVSGYAELRAKTCYSFLRGASTAEELCAAAKERGLAALGLADLETLAGAVRAHVAAKEAGMPLLVGAEVRPADGPALVLYPVDREGYGRLARLLTVGRRRAEKGECRLGLADVAAHAAGLIALLVPPEMLARPRSGAPPGDAEEGAAEAALGRAAEVFPGRAYLVLERHLGPRDPERLAAVAAAGRRLGLPLVAANDVHYHVRGRARLQDVLVCIRERTPIDRAGALLFPNAERHLKGPAEMAALFADYPEAVARTLEVAERVHFTLDELRYEYPDEIAPDGLAPIRRPVSHGGPRPPPRGDEPRGAPPPGTALRAGQVRPLPRELLRLERLTWEGAARRYPEGVPERVRAQLEHELRLIAELRYEPFFLTVHDIVAFARSRGILCQGRGSAANSAVCYCIGITSVDPARASLLFERFVSRERREPPDIDVDFEHERREEVIQHVYEKYGRERAGIVAEVIRYRGRSAVRDVGKALGLSLDQVDRLAGQCHGWSDVEGLEDATESLRKDRLRSVPGRRSPPGDPLAARLGPEPRSEVEHLCSTSEAAGIDAGDPRVRLTLELAREIQGFPRHLSQHVGGFVITRGPLCELVPIENAAMDGRTVIEWDKDDIDALGILKVDCLALGMLTAIRKGFDLVAGAHGARFALATVPAEDPETYAMCARADTVGVFQIESRAQMSMLPRLRPRTFYDLVVEVAIVRPGPIQGGMVHPYIRRRNGEEAVTYPSEALRDVLEKTLGVPLFQEQAMRLSMVAAGFTPGEADQLRRAMGAWRRPGLIDGMRRKLVEGMRRNGYSGALAEQIFEQLKGFGEYGFPESHAASFALLAYVSAWLKRRYPAAFTAALLNSQPMGFYAPAQLVQDAIRHGIPVRPVDVLASGWECTLEGRGGGAAADGLPPTRWGEGGPALRLGMRLVRGLGEAPARAIVAARSGGPFRSVGDLARRARIGTEPLARLAAAGGFRGLGRPSRGGGPCDPRRALWEVEAVSRDELPLFAGRDPPEPAAALPEMSALERVVEDYGAVGLSLERHPVSFLRASLARLGAVAASRLGALRDGVAVAVGGLVTVRQRPQTAKGIIFMSVEDETGTANIVLRPALYERRRAACFDAPFVLVRGRVEKEREVVHVLAREVEPLSLAGMQPASRDFQ